MSVSTKRKKKKMKKQSRRSGRHGVCAVPSKRANVLVELDADFLMMSK